MTGAEGPTIGHMSRLFARIGCLSFGGPVGQIALMQREIVDERGWIGQGEFLHALNFCTLLPGPEAQQLATWIGWRLHGVRGGLIAGTLFIVPGAAVMLAFSLLYALAARLDWFAALLLGVKAAVLAIVAQALLRIADKTLRSWAARGLALFGFAGLFLFDLAFPLVIFIAGVVGFGVARLRPAWLGVAATTDMRPPMSSRPWGQSLRTVLLWGALWAAPLVLIALTLGKGHVLWQIGTFFARLAVVTFGGAYAVLSYMAQSAVHHHHWLTVREMADGLGLAETTPGPLILVTQFVGFLAAMRAPEPFAPLAAGIIGAALTLWMTFVPSFMWIFTLAPWLERVERAAGLRGFLAGVSAAVVGVIANLALWFALHVLFHDVRVVAIGPLKVAVPGVATLDIRAFALAVLAALLLFAARRGILVTLALCSAAGLVLGQ